MTSIINTPTAPVVPVESETVRVVVPINNNNNNMGFSQEEIDNATLHHDLHNNPGGGSGDDYTEVCTILEDPDNPGQPLYWQNGEDPTASGFERHQIGITHPKGTNVIYTIISSNNSLLPSMIKMQYMFQFLSAGVIPLRPNKEQKFYFGHTKLISIASTASFGALYHAQSETTGGDAGTTIPASNTLTNTVIEQGIKLYSNRVYFKEDSAVVDDSGNPYKIVAYAIVKPWDGIMHTSGWLGYDHLMKLNFMPYVAGLTLSSTIIYTPNIVTQAESRTISISLNRNGSRIGDAVTNTGQGTKPIKFKFGGSTLCYFDYLNGMIHYNTSTEQNIAFDATLVFAIPVPDIG